VTRAREEKQLPKAEKLRLATTIQVTSPTFVAHLQIYRGEVVAHTPVLEKWVKGRRAAEALDRLREQRWRVEIFDAPQNEGPQ
jgi:hypothetical protein